MLYHSGNVAETRKIATRLAARVAKFESLRHAAVIALEGELGAGKTTFVKAFAKTLGVKQKITSPTFVLVKRYKLQVLGYKFLFHVDAYRLKDYRDLLPLGIREIFNNPENMAIIEWADRVKPILPRKHVAVHMDHIGGKERKIKITNY